MVASRSSGIRVLSVPGARSPASDQARSRAVARALRIARNALGPASARVVTSLETVGSDGMGPNSSGEDRSTAMSARQSPPSASVTARSATILPGSCTARGVRHRESASDRPWPRPVTRSASISSSPPAWLTIPEPSDDTMILRTEPIVFTWKVPLLWRGQDLRQALSSQLKGTFLM